MKEYAKTSSGGTLISGLLSAIDESKNKGKSNFINPVIENAVDCKKNLGEWKYNKISRDWNCE